MHWIWIGILIAIGIAIAPAVMAMGVVALLFIVGGVIGAAAGFLLFDGNLALASIGFLVGGLGLTFLLYRN